MSFAWVMWWLGGISGFCFAMAASEAWKLFRMSSKIPRPYKQPLPRPKVTA